MSERLQVYRGVVRYVSSSGNGEIVRSKSYDHEPRHAKTWVTQRRKNLGTRFVEGWIEVSTGWERYE